MELYRPEQSATCEQSVLAAPTQCKKGRQLPTQPSLFGADRCS